MGFWKRFAARQARAVGVASALAAFVAGSATAQDEAKFEACKAALTHACVLDLMWDQMPKVDRDYQAETKRAFIDAALLTGDETLIELYKERTGWKTDDALDSSYISVARAREDRATLVAYGEKALSGLSFDWYQLAAIARGLAEVGDIDMARKVAELLPHGPDDPLTPAEQYRTTLEVIAYHDPTPVTFISWADRLANDNGWWEQADIDWLEVAAARAGNVNAFPAELQERYRADGWKYLRALARLAPEMTASGPPAAQLFRGYVDGWADPRNEQIAEFVLAIAMRAHPESRAAMLAAFDARLPSPTGHIARMRALANDPTAALGRNDRGLLGMLGGSYAQVQAARALGIYRREEFLAKARAGEDEFSLSRPATLRAALDMAPDHAYALAIGELMAELGEPRTIDGYDYAQYATEWAMQTCEADLFKLAESRLARRDFLDTKMWIARFNRSPLSIVRYLTIDDRISSEMSSALRGYEQIILRGYCKGG